MSGPPYISMCFLKLSLSLLMAIAFQITASSPTSGDDFSHDKLPSQISIAEVIMRVVLSAKSIGKIMYWALAASEVLAYALSDGRLEQGCNTISLAYWIGALLALAGCLLRILCYAALGSMFTFTLTVQPDHRLITHGPYAFVRHPSYTGLYMCVVGIVIAQTSPGSWLMESGMLSTLWGTVIVLGWLCVVGTACICTALRMKDEDALMKEMFGDVWIHWATKQARYRLIPWLY